MTQFKNLVPLTIEYDKYIELSNQKDKQLKNVLSYNYGTEYRIQKRLMSPDIIEKNIGTFDHPKWIVFICPIGSRNNNIAHKIIKTL